MPIYEYKCSKCASVFEIIQKVDAPGLKKCLKCQAPVHKIVSSSAFQFKGSGWYVTDYANKPKNTPESKEASGPKEPKETPKPAESAAVTEKSD